MVGDVWRCEDVWRCLEMWGNVWRCEEVFQDVRCVEMCGVTCVEM